MSSRSMATSPRALSPESSVAAPQTASRDDDDRSGERVSERGRARAAAIGAAAGANSGAEPDVDALDGVRLALRVASQQASQLSAFVERVREPGPLREQIRELMDAIRPAERVLAAAGRRADEVSRAVANVQSAARGISLAIAREHNAAFAVVQVKARVEELVRASARAVGRSGDERA